MAKTETRITETPEHTVEIITNSGEGAQKCAQIFGQTCAKMGNGVWTVEIIPAEIEPPHRSRAGASGNRIRLCCGAVTNAGDAADVIIALNEQVLIGREAAGEFKQGAHILLENKWAQNKISNIVTASSNRPISRRICPELLYGTR